MQWPCAWSGNVAAFRAFDPAGLEACLGLLVTDLQAAIAQSPLTNGWIVLDVCLRLLGRRVDAILATSQAVLAIQYRPGQGGFRRADLLAAEDAALDLAEFHDASRDLPVIPLVLVPNGALLRQQWPLPLAGAAAAFGVSRLTLPRVLDAISRFPTYGNSPEDWARSTWTPAAGLLEAARGLYAAHGVTSLRLTEAGPAALRHAQAAIAAALADAEATNRKTIVFVTGAPGAGKTLCGLDVAFGAGPAAAFLTANPALVHVLREALVRDAAARGMDRRAATRRMQSVIQALPAFRDHHVGAQAAPSARLLVIDEAQRCWAAPHAVGKTRNRPVALQDSEAGHLLDIMDRLPGWAALVCLLGGGQEIHDGEGGLAAWGDALQARPHWSVWAPPTTGQTDPRQRLPPSPAIAHRDALHLATPVRAVRAPRAAAWVDAVLADDPARAASLAPAPFTLTRSLTTMRTALRRAGTRSVGLLASSTARRLRAEGLGAVLPHQDEAAVARWFLDRWPDIRSSDALEVVATEFAVQGLELDRAGLCWDADLVRDADSWQARRFRASAWTRAHDQARSNRLNAYRVLLTRARHGTIIWIPRGDQADSTRDPARYDAVAAYLLACGAISLDVAAPAAATLDAAAPLAEDAASSREPALL